MGRVIRGLAVERDNPDVAAVIRYKHHRAGVGRAGEADARVECGARFAQGVERVLSEKGEGDGDVEQVFLDVEKPEIDDAVLVAGTEDVDGGLGGGLKKFEVNDWGDVPLERETEETAVGFDGDVYGGERRIG